MIDWDRVAQLREEVGEDDFHEVVAMFLDEVSSEMEELPSKGGAQELEATLHFLKGAALNLGLQGFVEVCRTGENAARSGHPDQVNTSAIVACYEESVDALFSVLSDIAAA